MKTVLATLLISAAFGCWAQSEPKPADYYDAAKKLLDQDDKLAHERSLNAEVKSAVTRLTTALDLYMQCAVAYGKVFDDGVSDATTIAGASRTQCGDYLEAAAHINNAMSAVEYGESLQATLITRILAQRAAAKIERSKPPPPRPSTKQM